MTYAYLCLQTEDLEVLRSIQLGQPASAHTEFTCDLCDLTRSVCMARPELQL